MPDCKSTYGVIQNLYKNYGEFAKNVAGVAAAIVTKNPASAAAAVKAAGKVEEAVKNAHGFWNETIAKNGPLSIGPRYMDPGTKASGTVTGPGQRTFISSTGLHSAKGRIQIWEQGGKGKTDISICLVDALGHHEQVYSGTLNENNDEQKNERQVVDKTFSDALGQFVVCLIDGDSFSNKLEYTLLLSEL